METNLLQSLDTVIIRVSDISTSAAWYAAKLGLKQLHADEALQLVVLDTFSAVSITLWETKERIHNNPGTATYPIFRTLDARAAHAYLNQNGVKTGELITEHVVTYFSFFDPDQNILEVCQVHG